MFVEDCGAISAYRNSPYTPSTPVSAYLFAQIAKHPTYAWDWTLMPSGIAQNATAPIFELYAKGQINKTQFVDMMSRAIYNYTR